MSENPKQQQCRTCKHFKDLDSQNKWCDSIKDYVRSWWTGCIRWKPKKESVDTRPKMNDHV